MGITFITTIVKAEGKNATGISVPAEAVAALGAQKRPKVKISLNGYTYRSTVAAYGDIFLLPLSLPHREAAGVQAGDQVKITLELDTEERIVEVPEDLKTALVAKPGALAAYEVLAYSKRKELVRQVEEAKTQETRERRIVGIVEKMGNPL